MVGLPMVAVCEGCGACCEYMGFPPGFAPLLRGEQCCHEDLARLAALPATLLASLRQRLATMTAADWDGPCCWFDALTRQCKHYGHRPQTCRDAIEAGDDACQRLRATLARPVST